MAEVQQYQHPELYISLLVSRQTVVVAYNEPTLSYIYFLISTTAPSPLLSRPSDDAADFDQEKCRVLISQ